MVSRGENALHGILRMLSFSFFTAMSYALISVVSGKGYLAYYQAAFWNFFRPQSYFGDVIDPQYILGCPNFDWFINYNGEWYLGDTRLQLLELINASSTILASVCVSRMFSIASNVAAAMDHVCRLNNINELMWVLNRVIYDYSTCGVYLNRFA